MSGGHGHADHGGNKGIALVWTAGALGAIGIAFCVIGFWFPTAVHLF